LLSLSGIQKGKQEKQRQKNTAITHLADLGRGPSFLLMPRKGKPDRHDTYVKTIATANSAISARRDSGG
jgi:hypothetical protein